jgi:hypothetical protein
MKGEQAMISEDARERMRRSYYIDHKSSVNYPANEGITMKPKHFRGLLAALAAVLLAVVFAACGSTLSASPASTPTPTPPTRQSPATFCWEQTLTGGSGMILAVGGCLQTKHTYLFLITVTNSVVTNVQDCTKGAPSQGGCPTQDKVSNGNGTWLFKDKDTQYNIIVSSSGLDFKVYESPPGGATTIPPS